MATAIDESLMSQSAKYADELLADSGKTVQTELNELNQNLLCINNFDEIYSATTVSSKNITFTDYAIKYKAILLFMCERDTYAYDMVIIPMELFKLGLYFDSSISSSNYIRINYVDDSTINISSQTSYGIRIYGVK